MLKFAKLHPHENLEETSSTDPNIETHQKEAKHIFSHIKKKSTHGVSTINGSMSARSRADTFRELEQIIPATTEVAKGKDNYLLELRSKTITNI